MFNTLNNQIPLPLLPEDDIIPDRELPIPEL